MARYVIERTLPGAGDLGEQELHDISWVESYVTGDKLFCVYDAVDPATIEEHARLGEFPCDQISEVTTTISPATGR